jgi:hypothetical protein
VALQRRTAFSSIVLNAGSSSPGELLMTWSTSDVAACCSNASARCCRASARSRLYFSSCCSRSARGWRFQRTRDLTFVLVERRPPMRVRLFTPLRDKVTSSAQSLVPCGRASRGSSLSILAEPHDELPHSITSSARASTVGGISMPSALAVLRLMISSYLVGACTGRSAGFSPLRMRST